MASSLGGLVRIWPRSAAPRAQYRAPAAFSASGQPTRSPPARNLPPSGGACANVSARLPAPPAPQRHASLLELGPRACTWTPAGASRLISVPDTRTAVTGGGRASFEARSATSSRGARVGRERGNRAPLKPCMAAASDAKRVDASLPCPAEYRPNVGICLVNRDDLVFVANRIDKPGSWQMPQGGIDAGEDAAAAARRELREETGVVSADLIAEVGDWLCYDFPPAVRVKLAAMFGKDWKGQAQKWFLFRYTGDNDYSEVNLLGDGSEKPEFDAWMWMDVPTVIAGTVEFKRPVYEAAFEAFEPHLQQKQVQQQKL